MTTASSELNKPYQDRTSIMGTQVSLTNLRDYRHLHHDSASVENNKKAKILMVHGNARLFDVKTQRYKQRLTYQKQVTHNQGVFLPAKLAFSKRYLRKSSQFLQLQVSILIFQVAWNSSTLQHLISSSPSLSSANSLICTTIPRKKERPSLMHGRGEWVILKSMRFKGMQNL